MTPRLSAAFASVTNVDRALLIAIAILIVLVPLPFGSVSHPWIVYLKIATALVGLAAAWHWGSTRRPLTRRARWALVWAIGLAVIGLVQIVPLPAGLHDAWWLPFADERARVADLLGSSASSVTLSVSVSDTFEALTRHATVVIAGLTAALVVTSRSQFVWAMLAVVIAATFEGFYGCIEYLSGNHQIFAYDKRYYLDSATGTFINRNHYATYLALSLPLALGLLFASTPTTLRTRNWRSTVLALSRPRSVYRLALAFALVVIWAGLLTSYSRGGLVAAAVGVAVVLFTQRRRRALALSIAAILVLALVFLLAQSIDTPGGRFHHLEQDLVRGTGRVAVWNATLRLVTRFPLTGTGLGTFDAAFPSVRPAAVSTRYRHAHNDWLQLASEGGLPALLCGIGLLATLLWPAPSQHTTNEHAVLAAAVVGSLSVVAIHAFVDFSIRIPAVAFTTGFLAGLRCSPAGQASATAPAPTLPWPPARRAAGVAPIAVREYSP